MHVPRKRFGQHFLHDKHVIQQLVDVIAPDPGDHLVEIGPGQGALTAPVLKIVQKMDAIEIDRDLITPLKMRFMNKGTLIIHEVDALEFDFGTLLENHQPLRIIGNLPYNISTPLIFHLLKYADHIQDMHFMLQKEVVDRMAAKPKEEAYGRLSIMVQYHCEVVKLFSVSPSAFYPPPQVESSIIRLRPYRTPPHFAKEYRHFADIVRVAFSHRRKTLKNSLKELMKEDDWKKIEIDTHLRPEELSVKDYVNISNTLHST
jgi:16S rRNA (adenine1518-N6/adenine1519-N6)-dimethyltransferase